ncbi:hypothetical protein JXQ70_05730 [bacterium]|nr:hypothetical protein [bacterium]
MRKTMGLVIGIMIIFISGTLYAAPGDTCATATVISTMPYTDANTNNCSCTNDAVDYSSCMGYYDSGYDGFYEYTNNTGADFLVEVCATDNIGSDYLGVGLYEGCPSAGASCLGFIGASTLNSCFTACLENGVTYYILVDNWASPNCADDYTLTLTNEGPCPTPPANDTCDGVIALACNSCIEGSTLLTVNDFDCSSGSITSGADLVYSFTLTNTNTVTIVAEADFDADFAVSTVCDDGSAGTLLCVDRTGTQTDPSCGDIANHDYGYAVWSQMLEAGTYYIWLDTYAGAPTGNFALEILCELYVELLSFDATAVRRGVRLDWETAVEVDVLGFNIFRQQLGKNSVFGEMVLLNPDIIPSRGGAFNGAKYSFLDPYVENGKTYRYTLRSVELSTESKDLSATEITYQKKVK